MNITSAKNEVVSGLLTRIILIKSPGLLEFVKLCSLYTCVPGLVRLT